MDYQQFNQQLPLSDPDEAIKALQMQPGGRLSNPLAQRQALGQYMYGPQFNQMGNGASFGDKLGRFGKNLGYGTLAGLANTAIPGLNLGSILLGNKIKTEEKFNKKNKKKEDEDPWMKILGMAKYLGGGF